MRPLGLGVAGLRYRDLRADRFGQLLALKSPWRPRNAVPSPRPAAAKKKRTMDDTREQPAHVETPRRRIGSWWAPWIATVLVVAALGLWGWLKFGP